MLLMRPSILLLLLLVALPLRAQMSVALSSAQGHPGDEVELTLLLTGGAEATALQATIDLPQGLTYVEGSAVLGQQALAATHQLSATLTGRRLTLYVYSLTLSPLTDGRLLCFSLRLGREPGNYPLLPAVVAGSGQGTAVACLTTEGSIALLCPQITLSETAVDFGRVPIRSSFARTLYINNTGNEPLTISGVECSVGELAVSPAVATVAPGGQQPLTISYAPQQWSRTEQATVVIHSDAANGDQSVSISAHPYSVNELTVTGGDGAAGQEVTVGVSIDNMEPIVAAQCCFDLPAQLAFVEGSALLSPERADGHQIAVGSDGGRLTFYVFSDANTPLQGTSGQLFTFRLRLQGTGASYSLAPQDVVLSNAAGIDMTSAVHGAEVRIAAPKLECDAQLSFGRVPMEQQTLATLTIGNSGQQPLSVGRVVFTSEAFTLLTSSLPVIAPGQSSTLTVACQPSGAGPFEGIMQLYTDDPEQPMMTITLVGEAFPTVTLALSGSSAPPDGYVLTVSLRNSLPVVALQADLHWLPEADIDADGLLLTGRAAQHQASLTKVADGHYRLYLWSIDNVPLNAGEGDILQLTYHCTPGLEAMYGSTLTADDIILSTADGQDCASDDSVQLQIGMKGDANGDGRVTIADVAAMVAHLLGHSPAGFNLTQADVDGDGTVNTADVMLAADIIIEKTDNKQ